MAGSQANAGIKVLETTGRQKAMDSAPSNIAAGSATGWPGRMTTAGHQPTPAGTSPFANRDAAGDVQCIADGVRRTSRDLSRALLPVRATTTQAAAMPKEPVTRGAMKGDQP